MPIQLAASLTKSDFNWVSIERDHCEEAEWERQETDKIFTRRGKSTIFTVHRMLQEVKLQFEESLTKILVRGLNRHSNKIIQR